MGSAIILTIVIFCTIIGGLALIATPFMKAPAEKAVMLVFGATLLIPIGYKAYGWAIAGEVVATRTETRPVEETLSDEEIFTVAAHILSLGKKSGCGSFDVTSRDSRGKIIDVTCHDGRSWRLENGAMLKINGDVVGY